MMHYASASQVTVEILSSKGKPLGGIAVFITPELITKSPRQAVITINQKDKAFAPYLSIIQRGQEVEFSNNDDITHHIFSASRQNNFSFKIRQGQNHRSVSFDQPGSVSMGCNVHDWMTGHLLVVDTPYFEFSDENGIAVLNIDDLGEATVNLWHPQLSSKETSLQKSFTLSDESTTAHFKLKHPISEIPQQTSGDEFDFLDDY